MATKTLRLQALDGRVTDVSPLELIPEKDRRLLPNKDLVNAIKDITDSGWRVLTAVPTEGYYEVEIWFVGSDDGGPVATVTHPFVSVKLQIKYSRVVEIKPEKNRLSQDERTQVIGKPDVEAANYLNGLGWITYNIVSGSNRGEREIWLKKAD